MPSTRKATELCAYLCKEYKLEPMADGIIIGHYRRLQARHRQQSMPTPVTGSQNTGNQWIPSVPRLKDCSHQLKGPPQLSRKTISGSGRCILGQSKCRCHAQKSQSGRVYRCFYQNRINFFQNSLLSTMPLEVKKTSEGIIFSKPSDFLSSRGYQVEGNKLNRPLERG